jgi:hypothetical protein
MFQRVFGRAEESQGAHLSLEHRLTRSPDSIGALSQPMSGRCLKAPGEDDSWFRAELDSS